MLDWLKDRHKAEAWLYVVEPGRYRLLTDEDAQRSSELRRVLERIAASDRSGPNDNPFEAESSTSAAVTAILLRVNLSFTRDVGWRLYVPSHSYTVSTLPEGRGLFLLPSEGYLELWTTDHLTRALERASDELGG